jgi:hypothetical protein
MMEVLRLLPRARFVRREGRHVADVVMRANEDHVVRIVEEAAKRVELAHARTLAGSHRVEADDDERIGRFEQRSVERSLRAVIEDALDFRDGIPASLARLGEETGEVRFLHVVEKASDALVNVARVGERLELGIEQPTKLEDRGKSVRDLRKRRGRLAWSTPREVHGHTSIVHAHRGESLGEVCRQGNSACSGGVRIFSEGIFARKPYTFHIVVARSMRARHRGASHARPPRPRRAVALCHGVRSL